MLVYGEHRLTTRMYEQDGTMSFASTDSLRYAPNSFCRVDRVSCDPSVLAGMSRGRDFGSDFRVAAALA